MRLQTATWASVLTKSRKPESEHPLEHLSTSRTCHRRAQVSRENRRVFKHWQLLHFLKKAECRLNKTSLWASFCSRAARLKTVSQLCLLGSIPLSWLPHHPDAALHASTSNLTFIQLILTHPLHLILSCSTWLPMSYCKGIIISYLLIKL